MQTRINDEGIPRSEGKGIRSAVIEQGSDGGRTVAFGEADSLIRRLVGFCSGKLTYISLGNQLFPSSIIEAGGEQF